MIPVNKPKFFGNEKKYLINCINTSWISSEGPYVKQFENKVSKFLDRKYGIAVTSGTAALEIAVRSLNLRKGDEIIIPTFSIISCLQAVTNAQCVPIFVDCDYRTFNINLDKIKNKVSKKTKAIIIAHIYGLSVDMDKILNFCKKRNLKVIEDAAEVIGLEYKKKKCGSFGDLSILSFYANKHINTGEGGMILTNNKILEERCKKLRNLNFQNKKRFIHYDFGFNYRMTNLQAGIGLAQLENIEKIIKIKRKIGRVYNELLKNIKNIYLPIESNEFCENIYWVYPIIIKDRLKFSAKQIIEKLTSRGIQCRPFFYPLHKQPALNKISGSYYKKNKIKLINSEKLYIKGFYIPSGLALNIDEQKKVSNEIKNIID